MTARTDHERAEFEKWLGIKPCGAAHDFGWAAWQARAAIAAPAPMLVEQPSDKELLDVLGDELDSSDEVFIRFGRAVLAKFGHPEQDVVLPEPVSDEQIKAVFLANGFTIKEGLTDLKPYVYQAARALLATGGEAQAVEQAPVLYVSKGQLDNHRDPDGPDSANAGRYLPARITPAGNFTMPLFAAPQAQAEHIKALIEVSRMPNQEHVADAHNAAVRHLRAIAAAKGQE